MMIFRLLRGCISVLFLISVLIALVTAPRGTMLDWRKSIPPGPEHWWVFVQNRNLLIGLASGRLCATGRITNHIPLLKVCSVNITRYQGASQVYVTVAAPAWLPTLPTGLAYGLLWIVDYRRRRIRQRGRCRQCGYNLRGLTEPRCPECGTPFDSSLVQTGEMTRSPCPTAPFASSTPTSTAPARPCG